MHSNLISFNYTTNSDDVKINSYSIKHYKRAGTSPNRIRCGTSGSPSLRRQCTNTHSGSGGGALHLPTHISCDRPRLYQFQHGRGLTYVCGGAGPWLYHSPTRPFRLTTDGAYRHKPPNTRRHWVVHRTFLQKPLVRVTRYQTEGRLPPHNVTRKADTFKYWRGGGYKLRGGDGGTAIPR